MSETLEQLEARSRALESRCQALEWERTLLRCYNDDHDSLMRRSRAVEARLRESPDDPGVRAEACRVAADWRALKRRRRALPIPNPERNDAA